MCTWRCRLCRSRQSLLSRHTLSRRNPPEPASFLCPRCRTVYFLSRARTWRAKLVHHPTIITMNVKMPLNPNGRDELLALIGHGPHSSLVLLLDVIFHEVQGACPSFQDMAAVGNVNDFTSLGGTCDEEIGTIIPRQAGHHSAPFPCQGLYGCGYGRCH